MPLMDLFGKSHQLSPDVLATLTKISAILVDYLDVHDIFSPLAEALCGMFAFFSSFFLALILSFEGFKTLFCICVRFSMRTSYFVQIRT